MEYRNIDNDFRLYKLIKRYYEDKSLTKNQLFWLLTNEGYSQAEIDKAVYDYYLIHVRTDTITYYFMWCICLVLIVYLLCAWII